MTKLESAFYNGSMNGLEKLAQIADCMEDEIDEPAMRSGGKPYPLISEAQNHPNRSANFRKMELPIYQAALPNGKHMAMLKTLLTSACEKNCSYHQCNHTWGQNKAMGMGNAFTK